MIGAAARWIGRVGLGALALAVAACGSTSQVGEVRQVGAGLGESLSQTFGGIFGGGPTAPPPRPARADLEALNAALLWVAIPVAPNGTAFIALADNAGTVSYVSVDRRTVTLRGGQVVGTHALIDDLRGYRSDPREDPTVAFRSPLDWPAEVRRVYRHADGLSREFARAAICRPNVIGPEEVLVYDRRMTLVRIDEACATPHHAFVNRYWVDADNGYVWRSEQWISPQAGSLTYEVIRPFIRG